jgi:tight adherence protein B
MILLLVLFVACIAAVVWPQPRRRLGPPRPRRLDPLRVRGWVSSLVLRRPRRVLLILGACCAVAGVALGGAVAGLIAAVYGVLGGRAGIRWVVRRRDVYARTQILDELCGLAADLRAGLPPAAVAFASTRAPASASTAAIHAELRMTSLVTSVFQLAETTGAPAADLVERIEADSRSADRSRAAAAAEAAGAQVTALLLAGLPLAGIGLGSLMGADPLHVLLHTPLGMACAVGAVALQGAGLVWADRLARGAVR